MVLLVIWGGGVKFPMESGTCSLYLRTCPPSFRQVPGLTVYQKICSGLVMKLNTCTPLDCNFLSSASRSEDGGLLNSPSSGRPSGTNNLHSFWAHLCNLHGGLMPIHKTVVFELNQCPYKIFFFSKNTIILPRRGTLELRVHWFKIASGLTWHFSSH